MAGKDTKELKSEAVLHCWIALWKDCGMDANHKDWKRSVIIERLVKETGLDEAYVKDKLSQNFRYARNKLIVAYVTRDYNNSKEGDLQSSRLTIQSDLQKRLKIDSLAFAVSLKKGSVKCGKVDGWNLPPSNASRGQVGLDWIAEFDKLI